MSDTESPLFRTPEDVAPTLGMSKTELRRYCRESGHCTRLSKNRIVLDRENIAALVAWVKSRNITSVITATGDIDHFA